MTTEVRPWTRADLERMPDDGNRYEVLDGELFVTPLYTPSHQFTAMKLACALYEYYERQHALGWMVGPGCVVVDENALLPDIHVIPGEYPASEDDSWLNIPMASLVVEIASDATIRRDLGKKCRAYARFGIPVYWVVDAENRQVHVFTTDGADPVVVTDVLRWQPQKELPVLEIPLESVLPRPSPRHDHRRLAEECDKLDPAVESAIAEGIWETE